MHGERQEIPNLLMFRGGNSVAAFDVVMRIWDGGPDTYLGSNGESSPYKC